MTWHVTVNDCRASLRLLPAASVDACVTDPPYELGFMGKKWDASGIAFDVEVWRLVLRALKPGGHLLAFGGTRTIHRMVSAIEDAGFEIRDSIAWMYGTGFPKSLDVSKAIDNAAGAVRDVKNGTRGLARWTDGAPAGVAVKDDGGLRQSFDEVNQLWAPATPQAAQWEGWGTALKPACEPVVMARKPLAGTVAGNVLAHGTGALNIDGARIGTGTGTGAGTYEPNGKNAVYGAGLGGGEWDNSKGRWPANVILDEQAAALMDKQSGISVSRSGNRGELGAGPFSGLEGSGRLDGTDSVRGHDDGGASRFFYVAKPSRAERDAGCDDLPQATGGEATDREEGSAGTGPRSGANRGGGRRNIHPTVKPIDLMRYLCRLVTPPGGLVLDPFCGSGTTGIAALLEGFRFLGFEQDTAHACIAWHRIDHWATRSVKDSTPVRAARQSAPLPNGQASLFK